MGKGSVCKILPVKNRLGELLHRPGGPKRDEAVDAAGKNVESLRDAFVDAIPGEIAALELILAAADRRRISPRELEAMLERSAQLLTLSSTFGYDLLDEVVKRFCDLACGMIEKKIEDVAPVDVHLRAMRLVCPDAPGLPETEADHMLSGLARVHAHYGITPLQVTALEKPEN